MKISVLAEQEKQLHAKLSALRGTAEDRMQQLETLPAFEQYQSIYAAYVALHKQDKEAFKRALFLSWYGFIEHSAYSGIKHLPKAVEADVIDTLLNELKQGSLDYEFRWMLTHYATANAYFEQFSEGPELLCKAKEISTPLPSFINKDKMETRGAMGIFWNFFFFFNEE